MKPLPEKHTTAPMMIVNPTTTTPRPRRPQTFIRELKPADYKPAAASLAASFATDEVARYFIDTPLRAHWPEPKKYALHLSIMEYIVSAHLLRGLVTAAGPPSDPYACIALWMPPGRDADDVACTLRSGMWRLHYKLDAEAKTRMFHEFFPLLHDAKHDVLGPRDADSYYLVYIGTRPGAQGMGLARQTIEYVTSRADDEGRACYLESSNEVNPAIYRRLGFEVVRRIALTRAVKKVYMDVMVREPSADGADSVPSSAETSVGGDGEVSVVQQLTGRKMPVQVKALVRGLEKVSRKEAAVVRAPEVSSLGLLA